jgi:hypothetical protein
MSGIQKAGEPTAASVEEDPNAAVVCSSPPCFMHELDPSYLGYLSREEVLTLLDTLLTAGWGGTVPDEARLRATVGRHLEALGDRPAHASCASRSAAASGGSAAPVEPFDRGPERLALMVREALPRVHDDALRRDLEEVLGALGKGTPHREGLRDKG